MNRVITAIIFFFLIATIFTMTFMYIQEFVGDPMISNFSKVGQELSSQQFVKDNISYLESQYQEAQFDYDTLFVLMWILLEVSLIAFAILSPKLPTWDFLTFLFFGTLVLNFAYSFIMDLTTWILQEFILEVLDSTVTYMPFYNWFNVNQLAIMFLNFIIVLAINQTFGGQGKVSSNPIINN